MSYTYPEALAALESIANDYIKLMRPGVHAPVQIVTDPYAQTASVQWDQYGIRIYLPVRAATSIMTQIDFEAWVSFVLHELGHPTYTDKAAWEKACRMGLGRLVNALEDVRMEKAVIASRIVPNAKAVLSRLVARKVAEARAGGWRPNARKEFGWTICVLGRAANDYAIEPADLAWIMGQIKPRSTVETILTWALPALAACGSTEDCTALAERIEKALAAPQTGPIDINPGKGEGEGGEGEGGEGGEGEGGEGEGGEGEGGEGGEGEGEGGEGEGEGEGGEGDRKPGEGQGEGEGGEGGEGGASDETPPGKPREPTQRPSDEQGEGEGGKGGSGHGDGTTDDDEKPVTDESELSERGLAPEGESMKPGPNARAEKSVTDILRDKATMQQPPRSHPGPNGRRGANLQADAARASRQRALLARALRANETDEKEGGRKAGRLDRGALTRAASGAVNVFSRRDVSEGYDTDVGVLLDASGSMSGHSLRTALEAGLVIAQAAGSVGASCTTEIFNSTGFTRAGALASKRAPNPADFGALVDHATGGTPLSAHIARAALSQAKRAPHKRRVLFVVTDGECDYGPRTVKRMGQYLEQTQGTVIAHVSIGRPLTGAFKAEVMVPAGKPLADIGLDHFTKVLQAL